MNKKTYEAPRLEVVEMENMLPIATSVTYSEEGATITFDDDMDEGEQSGLRSSGYTNLWDE